jgi:hypothetical protein
VRQMKEERPSSLDASWAARIKHGIRFGLGLSPPLDVNLTRDKGSRLLRIRSVES